MRDEKFKYDRLHATTETDHRIANHLSLVAGLLRLGKKSLSSADMVSREEVERLLDDCSRRIEAVARVHRLLAAQAQGDDWIDVCGYLREIAEGMVESLVAQGALTLKLDCRPGCVVRADHVASLGLIVTELITNAVKYAHPSGVAGVIAVSCAPEADGFSILRVTDDGVGLPEEMDPATSGNIGCRLIRSLAQRIDGDVDYDSSCRGLAVTLRIPSRPIAGIARKGV